MTGQSSSTRILLVHGTWGQGLRLKSRQNGGPRWFEEGSQFVSSLRSGLRNEANPPDVQAFLWSGANSIEKRQKATRSLADVLDQNVALAPDIQQFVVAHSHGGNIAIGARMTMSGDARNVHLVTMATPFISIYDRPLSTLGRSFAICVAIGLMAIATMMYWSIAWNFLDLSYALYSWAGITLISIIAGGVSSLLKLYRRMRGSEPPRWFRSKAIRFIARVNERSLLALFAIVFVGSLMFGKYALFSAPILLPPLLMLFATVPGVMAFLFGAQQDALPVPRLVPNLVILRSRWDEASRALWLGKFTSVLAEAASALSIAAPLCAAALAALALYFVADYITMLFQRYQDCVSTGKNCFIPGEQGALYVVAGVSLASAALRYLLFGVGFCIALVVLAAIFKSFFAKELMVGSLNVHIDVFDTPGGSRRYQVEWCSASQGNAGGLRHSLYNEPNAIEKVVDHIRATIAAGPVRDQIAPEVLNEKPIARFREGATALAAAVALYFGVALWAYAPPGAASAACALKSYFEPAGKKGGVTILLASLEGDKVGVGDTLAAEITKRYGLTVHKTCLHVTPDTESGSAPDRLLSRYGADLLLWGRVDPSGRVDLKMMQPNNTLDGGARDRFQASAVNDFVAKNLRIHVLQAVRGSARQMTSSNPPANLLEYADQVQSLLAKQDWGSGAKEGRVAIDSLREQAQFNSAAANLMLAAGIAAKDGAHVAKAVDYFKRAYAIRNTSKESKYLISEDWEENYKYALLVDARMNKNAASGELASAKYLFDYEGAKKNSGASTYQCFRTAGVAASAASALYAITQKKSDADKSIRLACESLLWLRLWQEDHAWEEKRDAELAKQGKSPGYLPDVPPPETTEAYQILVGFGKSPSDITKSATRIKRLQDCENF